MPVVKGLKPVQKRPKGILRPVTEAWQRRVKEELETLGWTYTRLADEVKKIADGGGKSAMTNILGDGPRQPKSSKLVDPICEVLKIAPPEFVDETHRMHDEQFRLLRQIDPVEYDRIVQQVQRSLARKGR